MKEHDEEPTPPSSRILPDAKSDGGGFMSFLNNASKVAETAVELLHTVNSVNNIDQWFNQMIIELEDVSTRPQALVEVAYFIGTLNTDSWKLVQSNLGIEVLRNPKAQYLFDYCHRVILLENNQFKNLLGNKISDAIETISYSIKDMDIHDFAGYFGLLKAYAEQDPKANAIYNNMRQMLLDS